MDAISARKCINNATRAKKLSSGATLPTDRMLSYMCLCCKLRSWRKWIFRLQLSWRFSIAVNMGQQCFWEKYSKSSWNLKNLSMKFLMKFFTVARKWCDWFFSRFSAFTHHAIDAISQLHLILHCKHDELQVTSYSTRVESTKRPNYLITENICNDADAL